MLVKPYEVKQGLIAIPDTVKERTMMIETRATVIEVGPEAWIEEKEPRAKAGDHVLISKFAGAMAQGIKDGEVYRFVNDRDIYCSIEE